MRIVLAGSVSFSERTLAGLIRNGAEISGVLGLSPSASSQVSDYIDLEQLAVTANLPYRSFVKINAPEVIDTVRKWQPDVLFVVGLSQLVHEAMMQIPTRGSIGFHPTRLPKGRGRAPVAWLTYDEEDGAASFFVLEKEADAGALFAQEPFTVEPGAYAEDVIQSVREAIDRLLDRWLPGFLRGDWNPLPQDEDAASWNGRRAPADGLIDWSASARDIARLVRATSRPYPGAYTYAGGDRVIIWRASESHLPYRGVTGRVLAIRDGAVLVQTGKGVLALEEFESESLMVGSKLGYVAEDEIHRLRLRVQAIEQREDESVDPRSG